MKRILKIIDTTSNVSGVISAVMLCASLLLVIVEVIMRSFFTKTLYITDEYTGYLMVGITFFALSYCLKEKGHIRMTVLHRLLKGRTRAYGELVVFAVGLVLMVVVTYQTFLFFWEAVVMKSQSMQISQTYLAIPKALMPLGSLVFALQFVGEILRTILQIRQNDFPELGLEEALEQESGF